MFNRSFTNVRFDDDEMNCSGVFLNLKANERIEPLFEIECRFTRIATPLGLCVGERLLDVASVRQGGRVLGQGVLAGRNVSFNTRMSAPDSANKASIDSILL
jgi:hypothetical protein